jgi:hypothetical protein
MSRRMQENSFASPETIFENWCVVPVELCFRLPFLYGHSLNSHLESIGKYLVIVCMGLFLPFVYCGAMTWLPWIYFRNVQKIE